MSFKLDSKTIMQRMIYNANISNVNENIKKINDAITYLESAKTSLENGGYVDNTGTIDRGVLKSSLEDLEEYVGLLNKVVSKIQLKIDNL